MTVYFIGGKPYIGVSNGFRPIDSQTYYMMVEQGEIDHTEDVFDD
jgi:hypothetical protein